MLERAGVSDTALGQDWIRASRTSLQNPVPVTLPLAETGYFPPDEALAFTYRMNLERGRRVAIDLEHDSIADGRLFVDLFRHSADAEPRLVAALESGSSTLLFDVDRDGDYVLRIQPELLRGGRFTVTQRTLASLPFPVSGLTAGAIQSGFGDMRDAGTRSHEGVDIFAARGTPVVAVSDGIARPGSNALGGTVIWLRAPGAGLTFYYAHLDSQAFTGTTRVRAGDVLGYVGNTGNARTTAPHLHFGIYDAGAIDPTPFLRADDATPAAPLADAQHLGNIVRVTAARTPLLSAPAARGAGAPVLPRGSVGRLVGQTSAASRIILPDSSMGFVANAAIGSADTPLDRERLPSTVTLLEIPSEHAPVVEVLEAGTEVDVIGRFGAYRLLRATGGRAAWARA
jgi:peptidoglycan LD-endopeptidase LytH